MIIADIHSHILPGVDDGSSSLAQSLDMLEEAYNNGTRHMVATPHFGGRSFAVNKDTVLELTGELNEELARRDINLTVYPGNEIRCTPDTLNSIKDNIVCSANQNRYLLVELPFDQPDCDIESLVLNCAEMGHSLVLAHPERYQYLMKDFKTLEKLLRRGVLLQCNADSIYGLAGRKVKHYAHKLMRKNMVSFVASDCHSVIQRGPQLSAAYNTIAKLYGSDTANTLLYDNPMRMIAGKKITK
ncbi:MAG: tyrosine-protein phosphatase [Clostridia bacterium]|nr:tyrosine-protein phosphatase [Clostridia bacterium]